ncbi:uracil-DNA glycosylase [Arcanobacterium hippocoleae]
MKDENFPQTGNSALTGKNLQNHDGANIDNTCRSINSTQRSDTAGSLDKIMAPDWAKALSPIAPKIHQMGDFLRQELGLGRTYLPSGENVFHAFKYPLANVRVLIVGQDPYPTPGHPIGLSFSVARNVHPLPRSLNNIYSELFSDLGIQIPQHGDLTAWCENGVMLLNRVLTVRPGAPASHRGKGWEEITEYAIKALVARQKPLVAILWGRQAQELTPLLENTPIIASAHPSPLSANRGFFGSKPFSRANTLLAAQGAAPINWQLH